MPLHLSSVERAWLIVFAYAREVIFNWPGFAFANGELTWAEFFLYSVDLFDFVRLVFFCLLTKSILLVESHDKQRCLDSFDIYMSTNVLTYADIMTLDYCHWYFIFVAQNPASSSVLSGVLTFCYWPRMSPFLPCKTSMKQPTFSPVQVTITNSWSPVWA